MFGEEKSKPKPTKHIKMKTQQSRGRVPAPQTSPELCEIQQGFTVERRP